MRGPEDNSSALQTARLPATVTSLIFHKRQIILSSKKMCEEDGWNPHEILRWRRMKLSTRKRSGSSRTFRNLQPTQIDYSRNSGVLRWRRSLLLVQNHGCALCKNRTNKHSCCIARLLPVVARYDLPRRSHKIIRIDLGMDPLNACLWRESTT